ncbi:hypothetical protein C8F01DRAFT_217667 [Mycena amicta]|nr:hypothetical protein C8F01DRAFT_217667 [Mycena amicta]
MSYYDMPPSPTSSASSSASSGAPNTPNTPDYQASSLVIPSLPDYADAFSPKVKPSTAERRASHNAVERARRETLNARFLDLAVLLPNLKHLRRPSKSAIVNSSIAHVRAARRYRAIASAQLRALNAECDSLRREVNAWRTRSGLRPTAVPIRDEAFAMVLAGEEPAFDPFDLDCGLDDEEDAEFAFASARRRRSAPVEAACEGPLVLSHPYAEPAAESQKRQHSGSPTPTTSAPSSGFHAGPVPVPVPVEPFDAFTHPATATAGRRVGIRCRRLRRTLVNPYPILIIYLTTASLHSHLHIPLDTHSLYPHPPTTHTA